MPPVDASKALGEAATDLHADPLAVASGSRPSVQPPGGPRSTRPSVLVGRYRIFDQVGAGGMATVHLGRLVGSAGFSRVVAIKRMHRSLSQEPDFVAMFRDEVRLAARVVHPNVVQTLDVVDNGGELLLVMEFVHGLSLAHLLRIARQSGTLLPPAIASSIVCGMLHGLHAAHEARDESNEPLGIIHRDLSPPNVLIRFHGAV